MKEEILSIASDLREGSMTTNEARTQLLRLFGVSDMLPELCSSCFRRNIKNEKICKCGKPFKGNYR